MAVHLHLLALDGINLPAAFGTALLLILMVLVFNLSARLDASAGHRQV